MENNTFNPLEWAQREPSGNPQLHAESVNGQSKDCHVENPMPADFSVELQKARAVCDELVSRGANIAESYDDFLKVGFALADGLGADGHDIYHAVCAMSTKYREGDCEKKWQECLKNHDGRTTMATYYKLAQDAGVDLSEIGRRFPSTVLKPAEPANPHGLSERGLAAGAGCGKPGQSVNNQIYNNKSSITTLPATTVEGGAAGLRELRVSPQFAEYFTPKIAVSQLPLLLRLPVEMKDEPEDRDKLLLSSATLYSGRMPNVYGIYGEKRVYPPLYQLIVAPSGARKGIISDSQQLLMPIEYELRQQMNEEQVVYEEQMAAWSALPPQQRKATPQPREPKHHSVFLAANTSATSLYEDLADNGEWGVIFETEADTLTQAMGQEFGKFSDGLRKAFHHERISYTRRTEKEHVCVEHPRLAMLLTCTPSQIPLLMPSDEVANGLANRYLYYNLTGGCEWRNPFAGEEIPLEDRLYEVGKQYQELYHVLLKRNQHPLQFTLTHEQQNRFNSCFSELLPERIGLYGVDFDAFVYRLGLSTFRMMMVFTTLRCAEQQPYISDDTQSLVCRDDDFQTVMTITGVLVNHTAHVYTTLLQHDDNAKLASLNMTAQEQQLFTALPDEFTTATCREKAESLGIPWRTAERYLGNFLSKFHIVDRTGHGCYKKKP